MHVCVCVCINTCKGTRFTEGGGAQGSQRGGGTRLTEGGGYKAHRGGVGYKAYKGGWGTRRTCKCASVCVPK
jgi:hypothetical protein